MSSPSSPVLQHLCSLDESISDFQDQLCSVLCGEEYAQCVPDLKDKDLMWLVDYLDKALDSLDPSSSAFRKCLRGLRGICGTKGILPTSYTPVSHLEISPNPFASGGYGDVYQGTLDGSIVCIKRIRVYMSQDSLQKATGTFCKEAVMWKRLAHPNILPLLGITTTPLQLISNWMPGGELRGYINQHPDPDRLGLLSGIADGLSYLHSCNVIHGDLKGPNILVDDSGNVRIADFGLATVAQNPDSIQSAPRQHGHTPRWTAPEVMNEGKCSKEADVFSFAMVMIEVFTGAIPYGDRSLIAAMLATTQGGRPPRPTHPTFTEGLWKLMQRCWDQDPRLRPKVSQVSEALLIPEDSPWRRLINRTLATSERTSLITTIFSDNSQIKTVSKLSGGSAQAFIDVTDEALDSLTPQIRGTCLRYLYDICGRQALLPRSLALPLCYDPTEDPVCHDGLTDMWKGQYEGKDVAAQVLRPRTGSDPGQIKRKFCREVMAWKALRHQNVVPLVGVTMTGNRLVMVSEWMVKGSIMEFTGTDINVDRLELLKDVTKGLIYMHDQSMIHGDLKGVNVLIDANARARLTGFSLITMASDQPTVTSPAMLDGTIRWMSPELLHPGMVGLKESRPTKESDCYALGMLIYEVLSGQAPFASYRDPEVVFSVLRGERPKRPQGNEGRLFTDCIWELLGHCWMQLPSDRPSAEAILLGLEGDTGAGINRRSGSIECTPGPSITRNRPLPGPSQAGNPKQTQASVRVHVAGTPGFRATAKKFFRRSLTGRTMRRSESFTSAS